MARTLAIGLALLISSPLLLGCASSRSAYIEKVKRARAEESLKLGRWSEAFDYLAIDLARPSVAFRGEALRILKPYPGFAAGLLEEIGRNVRSLNNAIQATSLKRRIDEVAAADVVDAAGINRIRQELEQAVIAANGSDAIPFLFSDRIDDFPALRTGSAGSQIFSRSLQRLLVDRPPADALVDGTIAYVAGRGKATPEYRALEAALQNIAFSVPQLRGIVRGTFPEFADAVLAALLTVVTLSTEPTRRLLEEDLAGLLQQRSPLLRVTRQPEPGAVTIILRELQNEERQMAERTRTVTVGYGEHDLAVAILLLPRNASTLFEVTEGGAEIAWAFEIVGRHHGRVVHERIIRDRVEERYHFCSNFRVVNVFGGVLRASTFPNDQIRSYCGAGRQPVNVSALRATVVERLGAAVAEVPQLAEVIRRSR